MIGLATEIFDVVGNMVFENADKLDVLNDSGYRRCSRTATLDGGCVIYDTGYSVSDVTLKIKDDEAMKRQIDFAKYLVENYGAIIVTTKDGAFLGVPASWKYDGKTLVMEIMVTEKISL